MVHISFVEHLYGRTECLQRNMAFHAEKPIHLHEVHADSRVRYIRRQWPKAKMNQRHGFALTIAVVYLHILHNA